MAMASAHLTRVYTAQLLAATTEIGQGLWRPKLPLNSHGAVVPGDEDF